MGLIRQADADLSAKDAYVLDFADVTDEAKRIVEHARSQAEQVLLDAKAERDELVSSAYNVGHQMGYEQGLSEGRKKGHTEAFDQTMNELREGFSLLDASWNEALASFHELRETMLEEARTDLVVLATEVAERVTKRYVELDEGCAAAQLREAIDLVLDRTKLVIEVNPADEEACREVLPKLMTEVSPEQHAKLVGNAELRRGSVIIRTPKGHIDASIDTQVRRIVHSLLRDRQRLIDEVDNEGIEPFAVFNGAEGAQQYDISALDVGDGGEVEEVGERSHIECQQQEVERASNAGDVESAEAPDSCDPQEPTTPATDQSRSDADAAGPDAADTASRFDEQQSTGNDADSDESEPS
jgi:flagellar assembly protein FliH